MKEDTGGLAGPQHLAQSGPSHTSVEASDGCGWTPGGGSASKVCDATFGQQGFLLVPSCFPAPRRLVVVLKEQQSRVGGGEEAGDHCSGFPVL